MLGSIFKLLAYVGKEYTSRHANRILKLRKLYNEEINKPESNQDFAILDNIERELCLIIDTIAEFGESNSKD